MNHKEYFKNKKITMLGLGLLGRGVNVAKFLAENGAVLTVTDLKTEKELAVSVKKLEKYKNIKFHLGGHKMSDFKNANMVIKSAGTPLDSIYVKEAKKNKIPIEMDASLFVKFAPIGLVTVGITGTRGKSTVTHLVHHILDTASKRVFVGGNVRGMATLPLLKKVKAGDIVVLELDSWQLQGFGEAKISPNIAVFTNLMRDHMNYYSGDMKKYFQDKANIFKYQKSGDILITGKQLAKKYQLSIRSTKLMKLPKGWKIKLLGKHNEENIVFAVTVCRELGVSAGDIKKGVESFDGVSGRLEYVCEKKGVKYYNDTTSTTPDALKVALASLAGKTKNIILIAGGNDKELDYKEAVEFIDKTVKELILIDGTATQKILKLIKKSEVGPRTLVGGMKEAVRIARSVAKKGDIVLLSPGATSFGIFKNEFDRGEQFVKEIKKQNEKRA